MKPWDDTMPMISSSKLRTKPAPPAATMLPTLPRIRQLLAAAAAMNIRLLHISWRMLSRSHRRRYPRLPARTQPTASSRGLLAPSSSPKVITLRSFRWQGIPWLIEGSRDRCVARRISCWHRTSRPSASRCASPLSRSQYSRGRPPPPPRRMQADPWRRRGLRPWRRQG